MRNTSREMEFEEKQERKARDQKRRNRNDKCSSGLISRLDMAKERVSELEDNPETKL